MALIDDLISQVHDERVRGQLKRALAEIRRRKKFGLVFEEHIPETALLAGAGIHQGSQVMLRREPTNGTRYFIRQLDGKVASISIAEDAPVKKVPLNDLLVIKPFGEAVYPVLQQTGSVERGLDRPYHVVINGENFHALQLLLFAYEGEIDCIYIDPPYNTGARDWKYNNNYVDSNDSWRHSKWLSFMEKRLKLARQLLKRDGILIVTIDEHEVSNLGVLLRQIFSQARVQMITIVTNTAGSMSPGLFSRAEEYAYFCFFGDSKPSPMEWDMLAGSKPETQFWFPLFRSRGIDDRPSRRPNLVYPIAVDPESLTISRTGRSLKERVDAGEVKGDLDAWLPDPDEKLDGKPVVWPILNTGQMSRWQIGASSLPRLIKDGFVRVREPKRPGPRPFTLSYVKSGNRKKVKSGEVRVLGREPCGALILETGERDTIPKTTWKVPSHDARLYGTTMLRSLIGANSFSYPKSPYAVTDTLKSVLADKPDAVVLDFFAGSGTTLQAVAMLNSSDEGRRRTILVTNNEIDEDVASALIAEGYAPGDDEYEALGICRAVTIPRVCAALTGVRPDGEPVEGEYLDGSSIADGFDENAVFFDLRYEDADNIEFKGQFEDIVPALWLAGGCVSNPANLKAGVDFLISEDSPFAVLLDEDRFRPFLTVLEKHPEITHVWLVTDSETAFARMRSRISGPAFVGMLYRDYLRNFRINVGVVQ